MKLKLFLFSVAAFAIASCGNSGKNDADTAKINRDSLAEGKLSESEIVMPEDLAKKFLSPV